MQKCLSLDEESIHLLKECKKKYALQNDSQVISFLLKKDLNEQKEFAKIIRQEFEENYLPKERIKWSTKVAEQNSIMLLDAINTLLCNMQLEKCIPAEIAPSPVIVESKKRMIDKIAYFKMKSDERKNKGS
jgi:hypothetical protein